MQGNMQILASIILTAAAIGAYGQSVKPPPSQNKPRFEVASVRLSGPRPPPGLPPGGSVTGGPGTGDPELMIWTHCTMRKLLVDAYDIKPDEISGPGWVTTGDVFSVPKYDITAKVTPGATFEQARLMLRDLLLDRFKMVVHHTAQDFPAYDLVIAQGGPKLQPAGAALPSPDGRVRLIKDKDGFPVLPTGRDAIVSLRPERDGHIRTRAKAQPISALAALLSGQRELGMRVVDKTGLSGRYDFTLDYTTEGLEPYLNLSPESAAIAGEPTSGQNIFAAVKKQLGLELVKSKVSVQVLVVDQIQKMPSDN